MMNTIKINKAVNRQLYDSTHKEVTSLKKLIGYIKAGDELYVVDSEGYDITIETLLNCLLLKGGNFSNSEVAEELLYDIFDKHFTLED